VQAYLLLMKISLFIN